MSNGHCPYWRLPSMEFYIFCLLLYPWTGAKHWKTSIHPLSTIFAPFSVREGWGNVILGILAEAPLTPSNCKDIFLTQSFLDSEFFWNQNFLGHKNLLTLKLFLDQNIFDPIFFWSQQFLSPTFFWPKWFWTSDSLDQHFFSIQNFSEPIIF